MKDKVAQVTRRSASEKVALAGLLLLVVVVPLVPLGALKIAGYRIGDLVTFLLPLAVVAAYPFLRRLGAGRMPAVPLELPALVFLAFAALSVVFADSRGGAVLSWVRYALYFALAIVAAAVLRRRENRRILLWTFAGTSLVTAGVAAYQYVRPDNTVLAFTGPGEPLRVFSTFVNPNFYAEYLVLAIAVGAALFFVEPDRLGKAGAVAVTAIMAVALVLTYTRGSWLAMAVGVVAGALLVDLRLVWVVVIGGGTLIAVIPSAWRRLVSTFTMGGSSAQRIFLWTEVLEAIRQHPLVGVGIGGYPAWSEKMRTSAPKLIEGVTGAHDSYLQIMAETGIPGGIAFLAVVASVLVGGFLNLHALRKDAIERGVNAALTVGLVAFAANAFVSNSFQHPQAAVFFWLLAGMQAAAVQAESPVRWQPITGGRLSRILFGDGAQIAPDLVDWEAKAE